MAKLKCNEYKMKWKLMKWKVTNDFCNVLIQLFAFHFVIWLEWILINKSGTNLAVKMFPRYIHTCKFIGEHGLEWFISFLWLIMSTNKKRIEQMEHFSF